MEFTIKVFVTDTVIRWAIDYHLHRDLKPTKKIIKEFLKTQIGLFGTDEDSLIGQTYFEETPHPDLGKYLKKFNLTEEA